MLLVCFATTLLPILILNSILVSRSLDSGHNTLLASQWQQIRHGIVNAPSQLDNGQFKLLRMQDKLADANTIIFGASTSFGITQSMFPADMHIYNFSKNGTGLNAMIAEAEYLMTHDNQVKWLIIPLDWSIGFIYREDLVPTVDLLAPVTDTPTKQSSWAQIIYDSLSYPRIEGLFGLLKSIAQADDKRAAFREIFLQPASDEYHCADGTLAKDFDIQGRGKCRGFNEDGSWTYQGIGRVSDASRLIMLATTSSSKYTQNLAKTRGLPNAVYLQKLAALARQAEQRGGGMVVFLPPLLTGMEAEFSRHPLSSDYLSNTKLALSIWAKRENMMLIDAGQSEKFGCTAQEFTDEHHADPACYKKIFASFWHNATKPDGKPLRSPTLFK